MKKDVFLGMVFCGGIAAVFCDNTQGMDNIDSLRNNPTDKEVLTSLVAPCVEKNGKAAALMLLNSIEEMKHKVKSADFEKVVAMVYALNSDWLRSGYYSVAECKYYVEGAIDGTFGPYDLDDFKDEPYLSTTYTDDIVMSDI